MNDSLIIQNHTLLEHFKQHLDLPENNDIIFSAPFGTGKTCFLRDDFTEKMQAQYNVIHLYPVNYSVASNEDIFELIKYDILFDLMVKFGNVIENLDDLQIDKGLAIQLYIQNNFKAFDFIQQIFKSTTKLGKSISDVLDILKLEKGKYEVFVEELKSNEYDTIRKYLESFDSKKGSLEFDAISALLKEILTRIKGQKDNILIIDDLDRIDPEHIFRIFNVLSAHRDHVTQKNKFGFDKVILVCDIENIHRIYEHRYGRNVDFQGYINKFYSKSIYEFDNSRLISEKLFDYLDNLKYGHFEREYDFYKLSINNRDSFYLVVHTFLHIFVSKNILSLRSLKNVSEVIVPNKSFYDRKRSAYYNYIYNFKFLMLIEYLSCFLGSRKHLIQAIDELVSRNLDGDLMTLGIKKYDHFEIIREFLEMIIKVDTMEDDNRGELEYHIKGSNLMVKYEKESKGYDMPCYINEDDVSEKLLPIDIIKAFEAGLKIVESRKLLA